MAESISEGTLKQWVKQKGDYVEADEEVATIETDKIDVSVNAPSAGVLKELFASEEDTVAVGQDLFDLGEGEKPAEGSKPKQEDSKPAEQPKQDEQPQQQQEQPKKEESKPAPPPKEEKKPEQPKQQQQQSSAPAESSSGPSNRGETRVSATSCITS